MEKKRKQELCEKLGNKLNANGPPTKSLGVEKGKNKVKSNC